MRIKAIMLIGTTKLLCYIWWLPICTSDKVWKGQDIYGGKLSAFFRILIPCMTIDKAYYGGISTYALYPVLYDKKKGR